MTWDAHQGHGFFGFTTTGARVRKGDREVIEWDRQPRWTGTKKEPQGAVVDIEEALAATEELRAAFWKWQQWPDAPPYTGGVLTDWPARESSALAFAKREWAAVVLYLKSMEA